MPVALEITGSAVALTAEEKAARHPNPELSFAQKLENKKRCAASFDRMDRIYWWICRIQTTQYERSVSRLFC
jgi:hypothetical protein